MAQRTSVRTVVGVLTLLLGCSTCSVGGRVYGAIDSDEEDSRRENRSSGERRGRSGGGKRPHRAEVCQIRAVLPEGPWRRSGSGVLYQPSRPSELEWQSWQDWPSWQRSQETGSVRAAMPCTLSQAPSWVSWETWSR